MKFNVGLKFLTLKKKRIKKKRGGGGLIDHKGSSQFHFHCPEPIPKD